MNQEVVTIRAVVPGEYIVNVHYYATKTNNPIDVNVKVEKLTSIRGDLLWYNKFRKKGVEKQPQDLILHKVEL